MAKKIPCFSFFSSGENKLPQVWVRFWRGGGDLSNPCRVSPVSCYASGLLLQVIRKKIPKSQLINELKKLSKSKLGI